MGNNQFEKIRRPENIKLPYMLDFYPLEDEKNTRISKFFENLKEDHLQRRNARHVVNYCGLLE